ncbi:MAG: hypothetical protein OEX02_10545 [Cyclobacteriaceae bacterium]|nr:hypothetical protein [Cyclobacteriaceae bacterium]
MRYLFMLFLLGGYSLYAQDVNSIGTENPAKSNSYTPFYEEASSSSAKSEKKAKKKFSKRQYKKTFTYKFNKHHDDLVEEFYKRRKRVAREKALIARKMKKPQYSDHSYFGHKRKPNIRPTGKRKFCHECGIVH